MPLLRWARPAGSEQEKADLFEALGLGEALGGHYDPVTTDHPSQARFYSRDPRTALRKTGQWVTLNVDKLGSSFRARRRNGVWTRTRRRVVRFWTAGT